MDLVQRAGVDVSDWSNYAGKASAANPRYCYEWAFVETGRVVVLNVWLNQIEDVEGVLVLSANMRAAAEHHSEGARDADAVWRRRAERFDRAVQLAARDRLPVRLIICDGRRRQLGEAQASKVSKRMLDPVAWRVASYNATSGDFTLKRGVPAVPTVDQFDVETTQEHPNETRSVTGTAYVRSAEVRRAALRRADGFCEYCGERGFETASGETFLETHHIVPLSEHGPDTPENVAALCPTHHREAHFGRRRDAIREHLRSVARAAETVALPAKHGPTP
jgi:hypothetical protein